MRIRTQTILAILPLFLIIGGAGSYLKYRLEQADVKWGLEQESRGIVVTVAARIDGDRLRIREGRFDPELESQISKPLQDTIKYGRAKRAAIYREDGTQKLFERGVGTGWALSSALSDDIVAEVDQHGLALRDHIHPREPFPRLESYSAIVDARGQRTGIAGIVTSGEPLLASGAAIRRQVTWIFLGVMALGILVALTLTRLLKTRLRVLARAAVQVANGRYEQVTGGGAIREVNDLANTFNTMSSILCDVEVKTHRDLIGAEIHRSARDLQQAYNERYQQPIRVNTGQTAFVAKLATTRSPHDLMAEARVGKSVYLLIGRLSPSDNLPCAEIAAIQLMWPDLIKNKGVEEALIQLSRLFQLETAECLEFSVIETGGTTVHLTHEHGRVNRAALSPDQKTVMIHTLSSEIASKVQRYLNVFEDSSPGLFIKTVDPVLARAEHGVICVTGRET